MADHTPTPWAIWDNELIVEACSDEWIADTICNVRALKENEANAAFIVRAVNAHDEIVEALEAAELFAQWVRGIDTSKPENTQEIYKWTDRLFEQLGDALQKARG